MEALGEIFCFLLEFFANTDVATLKQKQKNGKAG